MEVGTGFHPELTGRENIYLNGAILGMRKMEISRKLDEIIDFSGVERYIDTPVKRYSSGMYVRLAFAVAAHLESEILIVDEVLAVGDADFQKKCLGKMGEVSKGEGRTVLFVSHNLQSINVLCKVGLVLDKGNLSFLGSSSEAVRFYNNQVTTSTIVWNGEAGDENIRLLKTWIEPIETAEFNSDNSFEIGLNFEILKPISNLVLGFHLLSEFDYELAYCLFDDFDENPIEIYQPGNVIKKIIIPKNTLAKGTYYIRFDIGIHMVKRIINDEGMLSFNIINSGLIGCRYAVPDIKKFSSLFRPNWVVKSYYNTRHKGG